LFTMVTLTGSTLSTTTTYVLPSPHSYPSTISRSSRITYNDDDEIVWNVSEGDKSFGLPQGVIMSDEDLVVLANPRFDSLKQKTPASATKPLEMQMSTLSLSSKAATKKAKKFKRSKKATASPVQGTTTTQERNAKSSVGLAGDAYSSPARSSKHADIIQVVSAIEQLGLGQRPIVDDLSDQLSVFSGDKTPTVYEEASTYISMFLSDPVARTDHICRLTLLQSLIIELGLATTSALPSTLSAAKAFLKARAFLNIREYMAVRGQGPEAVQSVLYPSKSALIKSIKKKRNATSIKLVKELGLQVLLVGYLH